MCAAVNNVYMVMLSTACTKEHLRSPKKDIMKWDFMNGTSDKIFDTVILPSPLLFFRTMLQQQLRDFDMLVRSSILEGGITFAVPDVHVGSTTKQ